MASSSGNYINEGWQQYPFPSQVNAASFVSIKLSDKSNYVAWVEQIWGLLEIHDMLGFIDGTIKKPRQNHGSRTMADDTAFEAKCREWKRSDTLVKGWILGSLSENAIKTVVGQNTAHDVWKMLQFIYTTYRDPVSIATIDATEIASQQYPYPSHVNAASFMSIKLSGRSNYVPWRKQMLSLVFSHDMHGFIEGSLKRPETNNGPNPKYLAWKRSDVLVQGWIFGSLTEDVMRIVVDLNTAHDIWNTLYIKYTTPLAPIISANNDYDKYIPLCRAIELGDWEKAQEYFNQDERTLTDKLDQKGNSALHIAIKNHVNITFLENLLNQINPESLPTLVNDGHYHPLQYAVYYENNVAIEKLVQTYPHLLFTPETDEMPLMIAASYSRRTTFDYLLKACKQYIELNPKDVQINPFKGKTGFLLIIVTLMGGFYDAAYDLLNNYPELTMENDPHPGEALIYLAGKCDAYRSAKRYNFYQRFVYSHLRAEIYNLGVTSKYPDIENQETNKVTSKSYVYQVMERVHVKFWKALRHVSHINDLYMDKVKHHKALTVLKFVCEKVGKLKYSGGKDYETALIVAVENNIPEVIEHITRAIPQSIRTMKDNTYTLYHLAIMNRCENAYNILVYEMNYHKDLLYGTPFFNIESLNHLAGKLAPQDKLNMVTGAALQMQRELQWFQEVRKLVMTNESKAEGIETPIMVFRREHEDLRQKGEEWMKYTANSYTITAALIITIVFAAAITVPGGNNGDTGKAIYKTKPSFIVFIVSDAISLFTATTSLLLFLSILTARYAIDDFLYKLPKRLILGLVMLFMSVTTMLIAFGATLYIMSGQENSWILIPISVVTCLPIASFVTLQLPLLYDLISSTYGRGIFGKQSELRITS
ncbi:uncharacterized protein LOC110877466 isoform X1 [Helianthus annuus]|nr:uncharacterized protein LOC110877466 isoform X1 [Helianthus annuus]